jgi:uncharacterized membrane protein
MFGTGWCGGMGVAGWLFMALIWGGFLAVVVWAVLRLFPRDHQGPGELLPPGGPAAAADLDRRLAAGEIDADTYLRQRDTLAAAR